MEQLILSIIQNLNTIEVRGEHAQRLGACIKALTQVVSVLQQAEKEKEDGK